MKSHDKELVVVAILLVAAICLVCLLIFVVSHWILTQPSPALSTVVVPTAVPTVMPLVAPTSAPTVSAIKARPKLSPQELGQLLLSKGFVYFNSPKYCAHGRDCDQYMNRALAMTAVVYDNGDFGLGVVFFTKDYDMDEEARAGTVVDILLATYPRDVVDWVVKSVEPAMEGKLQFETVDGFDIAVVMDKIPEGDTLNIVITSH